MRWRTDDDAPRHPVGRFPAEPDSFGRAARHLLRARRRAVPVPGHAIAQRGGEDLLFRRARRKLRPAAGLHRHRLLRPHHVLRHRRLWRRARALYLGADLDLGPDRHALGPRARSCAGAYHRPVLAAGAVTGGEDGRTFRVPEVLRPGYSLLEAGAFSINGRIITYYLIFLAALVLFLGMLRVVNSPFGRVLQGIRENEFRAEALGYRTIVYRSIVNCLSAAMATLAGVLAALWLRYPGPAVTLSSDIMLDSLLMVVIGGMGTLYGAVIGATIFILAENYLQALMGALSKSAAGLPVLPQLFDPDRWLLWLGVLFVLSVYFFPAGIVGKLAARK